jgi:hypothetical protein
MPASALAQNVADSEVLNGAYAILQHRVSFSTSALKSAICGVGVPVAWEGAAAIAANMAPTIGRSSPVQAPAMPPSRPSRSPPAARRRCQAFRRGLYIVPLSSQVSKLARRRPAADAAKHSDAAFTSDGVALPQSLRPCLG